MNDLSLPLPATYDAELPPRQGKLDLQEPPRLQDLLEDWAGPFTWMIAGALLAMLYAAIRML